MKRLPRDQEKELLDQARLLKSWRAWHDEELEAIRRGPHGSTIDELMLRLDQLELCGAAALLAFMQGHEWSAVDHNTRLEVLHRINSAIERVRTRNNLPPLDDPLPGQSDSLFRRIKQILFPLSPTSNRSAF